MGGGATFFADLCFNKVDKWERLDFGVGDVSAGAGTLGSITCSPTQPSTLAPTDHMTCNADYVVVAGDLGTTITNTATATSNESPDATADDSQPVPTD